MYVIENNICIDIRQTGGSYYELIYNGNCLYSVYLTATNTGRGYWASKAKGSNKKTKHDNVYLALKHAHAKCADFVLRDSK